MLISMNSSSRCLQVAINEKAINILPANPPLADNKNMKKKKYSENIFIRTVISGSPPSQSSIFNNLNNLIKSCKSYELRFP